MDERNARDDDQGAGEQADRMEREAERMEERSSQLGKDVRGVKSDWESKQQEDAVPGAQTEESLGSDVPEDETDAAEVETDAADDSAGDDDSPPAQNS